MALYATNRFAGDGVTTQYEINFTDQYIDRAHVKAYRVDNDTHVRTPVPITPEQWINATTIGGFDPTPTNQTLVIYRDTPKAALVDFSAGSRLTEHSLDLATRQGLFVAAEVHDALLPQADPSLPATVLGAAEAAALAAAAAEAGAAQALVAAEGAEAAEAAAAARTAFWLPAAPAAPGARANGDALQKGDLYFDTTQDEVRVWRGASWEPVAADLEALAAPTGGNLVTTLGPEGRLRSVQTKTAEVVSVFDFMTPAQIEDARQRTLLLDSTGALTAAVSFCLALSRPVTLVIPGVLRISSPVTIFRAIGAQVADFTIRGEAGGGFYVAGPFTLFTSASAPNGSVGFVLRDLLLEGASPGAYALSPGYLVQHVLNCRFQNLALVSSPDYLQSWRVDHNYVRAWSGTWVACVGAYDVSFTNNMFEWGGTGIVVAGGTHPCAGFRAAFNLFQGCSGGFLSLSGECGVSVLGNYTENNAAPDYRFSTTVAGRGIQFAGNFIAPSAENAASPSFFSVIWGVCAATSTNNYGGGGLHKCSPGTKLFISGDVTPARLVSGDGSYPGDPASAREGAGGEINGSSLHLWENAADLTVNPMGLSLSVGSSVISGSRVPVRIYYAPWSPLDEAAWGYPAWAAGSRVFNTNMASPVDYWVCTASGTPGTWEAKLR